VPARAARPAASASTSLAQVPAARAARTHERAARVPTTNTVAPAVAPAVRSSPASPAPASTSSATSGGQTSTGPASTPTTATTSSTTTAPDNGAQPGGFVPSRAFAWADQPGATGYIVRFFRDGKKILERRSVKAQLTLPPSFHFTAGNYRWQVIPIVGPGTSENLAPIVDSTFVLTAAAAAEAGR
jgi:hypothetical protein